MSQASKHHISTPVEELLADAYFLAACFYEIICRHSFAPEAEKCGFLSAHYAGMVHHKLYLLGWRERVRVRDSYFYLLDSIAYYQRSLEFEAYGKQKRYQYDFLAQLNRHAQDYIRYFGQPPQMDVPAEYRAREDYYRQLGY